MADLSELHEAILRLEAARDEVNARLDQIEAEWAESGAGDDDPVWRERHNFAEQEAERIQMEIDDAEDDFQREVSAANEDDDEDDSESVSVDDAAAIWASKGMDEDYTFGYSEEELRKAL